MKVKKAVIAAAGFGTRMLPQTKAIPKEMLPIVNKPVIQYIVEEIVEAGITDIVIITGYHKRSIEDHFDYSFQLNEWLKKSGKRKQLSEIRKIADMANFVYVRQKDNGYGNAIPIQAARQVLGEEPFLLLWGDIIAQYDRTKRAINAFEKYNSTIVCATKKTDKQDYESYGYIEGTKINDKVWQLKKMVEKPGEKKSKSNLAVMNGYVLAPTIHKYIEKLKPNEQGEYCLIDAISQMAKKEKCYGIDISDIKQYDTGNKVDYIKTNLEFALQDRELRSEIISLVNKLS